MLNAPRCIHIPRLLIIPSDLRHGVVRMLHKWIFCPSKQCLESPSSYMAQLEASGWLSYQCKNLLASSNGCSLDTAQCRKPYQTCRL